MMKFRSSEIVNVDYRSEIKAIVSKQKFSIRPLESYVDITLRCEGCKIEFCFSAKEQKLWYEEYGFIVDSYAKNCRKCRSELRRRKALRRSYDRRIHFAIHSKCLDDKKGMALIIDEIFKLDPVVPYKIRKNHEILECQIKRLEKQST